MTLRVFLLACSGLLASYADEIVISEGDVEVMRLLARTSITHRPPSQRDETNRYSGIGDAIAVGELLFSDRSISANHLSCADCHRPSDYFQDNRPLGLGHKTTTTRRTQSLVDVSAQRWLGWAGQSDAIWVQTLRVFDDPNEVNLVIPESKWAEIRGKLPSVEGTSDNLRKVVVAKLIAAYVETIQSGPSRWDLFLADIQSDRKSSHLIQQEWAGAKLFAGKGSCISCHNTWSFSDGEFHNTGLAQDKAKSVDPGRYGGYRLALNFPMNAASLQSDSIAKGREKLALAVVDGTSFSAFKTPSLRGMAGRKFFMHDGRFSSLNEVIHYYSTLDGAEFTDHHESVLVPAEFTVEEADALLAFLRCLQPQTVAAAGKVVPQASKFEISVGP